MKRFFEKYNLQIRMTALVLAELLLLIGLTYLISYLFHSVFGWGSKIPAIVESGIVVVVLGTVCTWFVGHWFFHPIRRLDEAMKKVAGGDFTVHFEARRSAREIRDIADSFNQMVRELNATEILQSDFVSNVSHEFKTPINAISGYATLLQQPDGLSVAEQEEYVERILSNSKRLSTLVGNVLLLSKVDSQAIPTDRTRFRLDEQIRQSILLLEPEWEQKKLDFDVEMDDVIYFGSESLLHHVWFNLISNAIKFNQEGGSICISLKRVSQDVVFVIEDTGTGIDETQIHHIFDRFYQADSSHKQEGNGLGLALVKQILNAFGGEIAVENREHGGARFTVTLHD